MMYLELMDGSLGLIEKKFWSFRQLYNRFQTNSTISQGVVKEQAFGGTFTKPGLVRKESTQS